MTEDFLVETRSNVATVTINRPAKRNAINYEGWESLGRICTGLAENNEVRVVIFTGQGTESFSAGADIADFEGLRATSQQAKVYAKVFDNAIGAIESIPQPTICRIEGFCIGGGYELALATDIRISADNGKFSIPAAKLGLLIGYREMHQLVNLVGPGNASYLLMSARQLDATEAKRIGLVNEVLPLAQIGRYVEDLAIELAELSPLSQRRHKTILRKVLEDPNLESLKPDEVELPFSNFDSEDFREGRIAFTEKRPPRFKGL